MDTAAFAIGLVADWPKAPVDDLIVWADAYLEAAEKLHEVATDRGTALYVGPTIQNVGIATELTLKALIKGDGASDQNLRGYSHNTYRAYLDARAQFDESAFVNLVMRKTAHIKTPDEVLERLRQAGEPNPDTRWRVYFDHLRLIDTVYDRPYRSRYITAGPIFLPETEIVLIGTRVLHEAMRERL